jgi:hypothetical protein
LQECKDNIRKEKANISKQEFPPVPGNISTSFEASSEVESWHFVAPLGNMVSGTACEILAIYTWQREASYAKKPPATAAVLRPDMTKCTVQYEMKAIAYTPVQFSTQI